MDDEFELNGELDCETDDECTSVLRATVLRDGGVSMVEWRPSLAECGPMGQFLRARERAGVAIADLRLMTTSAGEREVIVEFMSAGAAREKAELAIVAWASTTGHRRVWLPSGLVDLDPPPPLATASATCRTCRARWVDATPAFWAMVHGQGHFPLTCPVCGHALPQWKVREGDETRCRG
jgi:hypothetical protein